MKEYIISFNDSAFHNNETGEAVLKAERVVELVRCGSCKHRSKLASEDSYGIEDWVCNHDFGCAKCDDDDFCRYGERAK